jgi:hypothetical protein
MLNKKPSGNLARLKYLLTLPLLAALLGVSTLAFSKTYGWVDLAPHKPGKAIANAPAVIKMQAPADTTKLKHDGKTYTYKNGDVTSKGYKYKETGYLVNGKTDFMVVITGKDGNKNTFMKSKCTREQISMLSDKYGYIFPSMDIFTKLPPPPPAPAPPAKLHGPKGPRIPAPMVVSVDTSAPARPAKPSAVQAPPPPMAPHMPLANAFTVLDKYMGKYTRYPAVARDNNVMGSVIMQFELNADHKIANVILIKGIGYRCDEEAMRVLNNYSDPIDTKPGTYKLAVTFDLEGLDAPKPASETLSNDPLFIGEVLIVGSHK